MRKIVLSIFAVLTFCLGASAQNLQITGTVIDPDGVPAIGVTVSVAGTSVATTTNVNGEYVISAPQNATLEFSYVGLTTKLIAVAGRSVVNAQLEADTTQIEELVVIGYGTGQKLGTFAGSVAKVDSEKLNNRPTPSVTDALQGQVAGLTVMTSSGEPSASASMTLHGVASLGAGNSPLVVIDGIPTDEGQLISMNGNDIESVTVLKDASSTSIYGSRAANGVLFITTKKGQRNQDAVVKVSGFFGRSKVTQQKFDMMNASELLEWQKEFGAITNDAYTKYKAEGNDNNWLNTFFNDNAPTFGLDASISGGTANTAYYISLGRMYNEGVAPRSHFERYNIRTNLDVAAKKWLRFGTNLTLGYDERYTTSVAQTTDGVNVYNASFASMLYPTYWNGPYDKDGNLVDNIGNFQNLLRVLQDNPNKGKNLLVNGNVYAQVTPIKGLTIKSVAGIDAFVFDSSSTSLPSGLGNNNSGNKSRSYSNAYSLTSTNTIEYKFALGSDHNFVLLAGQEAIVYQYDGFGVTTTGQSDDRMTELDLGTDVNIKNVEESTTAYAYNSYFGRFGYNFRDKYSIDLTLRNDASSRFGKYHRDATFYSVGVLWNMLNEPFMEGKDKITDLKLRATYGTSGNSDIGDYASLATVGGASPYNGKTAWVISTPGNPELTWETQKLANVSLEIGFYDRITTRVEYFHRSTGAMLMTVPTSLTSGFSSTLQNTMSILNQGVDIELNAALVRTKDLYVGLGVTVGYNKNIITELWDGRTEYIIPNTGQAYVVGKPYGAFYYPVFVGVDSADGAPIWLDENGNNTKDINKISEQLTDYNRYPDWTGGFNIDLSWKGFSINGQFSWIGERYIINNGLYFVEETQQFGSFGKTERMKNIWRKPGDVTNIPKYGSYKPFDTSMLEDASFLRLKNITVSYDLPKSLLQRSGFIEGLRIYFTGRNIWTLTKYSGYDPEVNSNIAIGEYPNTRQYTFGAELTF